jgi:hypothetical protein
MLPLQDEIKHMGIPLLDTENNLLEGEPPQVKVKYLGVPLPIQGRGGPPSALGHSPSVAPAKVLRLKTQHRSGATARCDTPQSSLTRKPKHHAINRLYFHNKKVGARYQRALASKFTLPEGAAGT